MGFSGYLNVNKEIIFALAMCHVTVNIKGFAHALHGAELFCIQIYRHVAIALKFRGVMIFSKSKAKNMRFDKKKSDIIDEKHRMSGCNGMLPAMFDNIQPVARTMCRKEDNYIAHRRTKIWRINYYIQFRTFVRKE